MNALNTVLMAGVEAPNTSVSMRVQMTSNTRPDAPERKKQRNGTSHACQPGVTERAAEGADFAWVVTGRGMYRGNAPIAKRETTCGGGG